MNYTDSELEQIRNTISGNIIVDNNKIEQVNNAIKNKKLDSQFASIIGNLAILYDTELFKKISSDEIIQQYGIFGFFPETYKAAYEDKNLQLTGHRANRGLILYAKLPDKNIVIKSVQSPCEKSIADIASSISVGPKQHNTLNGFLTEEYLDGNILTKIRDYDFNTMMEHGREIGLALNKLHDNDIIFNDTTIADDNGNSNILITASKNSTLFDFGVAINISKHPNYSNEEIINYIRTKPFGNMINYASDVEKERMINDQKIELQSLTREAMIYKDTNFLNEGLYFLNSRIGSKLASAFSRGISETYKESL